MKRSFPLRGGGSFLCGKPLDPSQQRVNKLQEVFDLYKVDSSIVIIRTKKPGKKKAAPGVTSTEGSGAE